MIIVWDRWVIRLALLATLSGSVAAQKAVGTREVSIAEKSIADPDTSSRPLPDIETLMRDVQANQRATEAVMKDYLFHEVVTEDQRNGRGGIKKTESREFDIFWINGVEVGRMVKKDGKELTEAEKKKEDERIDKEVSKAKERRSRADAEGKVTDSHGEEKLTISRALALGSFTNERRVVLNGRPTIAVDFAGNPKAKTKNAMEGAIREMAGTLWVDEQDKTLSRVQGRFVNSFKIGAGMLVNVKEGTNFVFEQKKVNDEVWLPAVVDGEGGFRAMLFYNFDGRIRMVTSDYRKFKATSTILPGVNAVEPQSESSAPPQ